MNLPHLHKKIQTLLFVEFQLFSSYCKNYLGFHQFHHVNHLEKYLKYANQKYLDLYLRLFVEQRFQMSTKKQMISIHESKLFFDTYIQTEINIQKSSQQNDIDWLISTQEKLKKDLAFWNSMVEGKLESLSSCINLFILLLILTLGSEAYNGFGTKGPQVLGWICVAQVSLIYVLIIYIKFFLIPSIEADLQQKNSEGFKIYYKIITHHGKIQDLNLNQLELLQSIVTSKISLLNKCFPHTKLDSVRLQIKNVLNSNSDKPYEANNALKELKQREKNAKWWQSFWQTFVLGKTFSFPGAVLLVVIITALSIATPAVTSKSTSNAQGWIAFGFITSGFLLFAIIKLFIWDYLNQKVQNSKCDLLELYHSISLKHQSLKNLSLVQLQGLKLILEKRSDDFRNCFPEDNANQILSQLKHFIRDKLPNKDDKIEETQLKQIIKIEKYYQSLSAAWNAFFNQKIIEALINVLKFLIMIAITFVTNYSNNTSDEKNAKIVVGSIGIGCFVFGYLFYFFLRAFYLDNLEAKAQSKRSSPFTTFRLVYFGNKKLGDLQPHQIEDISQGFNQRKEQFLKCFPKVDSRFLDRQLHQIIRQKLEHHYETGDKAYELLKKQSQAKKMLNFWIVYVDNPLLAIMYSVYVLLVLLIVTITGYYDHAPQIVGWIGVATISLLIVLVFFIKMFVIDYKTKSLKALRVPGYSEYNLVYNKNKELSSFQPNQLQLIHKIIQENPIQFKKCFPKSNILKVAEEIKFQIKQKEIHHHEIIFKYSANKVKSQQLMLQINRCKNALSAWKCLTMDKIYGITRLAIVTHILWVQSIATTLYGLRVCAFLAIASLVIIIFLVLFFVCYYRGWLQRKISECQQQLMHMEKKEHQDISIRIQ